MIGSPGPSSGTFTRSSEKGLRILKKYLVDNWVGIAQLPEEERLGAIEGQVRHIIARRMKRIEPVVGQGI